MACERKENCGPTQKKIQHRVSAFLSTKSKFVFEKIRRQRLLWFRKVLTDKEREKLSHAFSLVRAACCRCEFSHQCPKDGAGRFSAKVFLILLSCLMQNIFHPSRRFWICNHCFKFFEIKTSSPMIL